MSPAVTLSAIEKRAIGSLASLYALRMLGLFMVLPVMMVAGQDLSGATPELLGLAMGAYGLSQALLQIPAGALSDYIGRKPVIIAGLLIFALGSFVAANADSIYGVIAGRVLQGCGAIASAIMALVSDLTREEHRMKAMASIGASIGLSFSVALVLGPVLVDLGGLALIFWVTGVLALVGIVVFVVCVPVPVQKKHRDGSAVLPELVKQLANRSLWPLNLGIFILHALMVAIFVAIPGQLVATGLAGSQHAWLYLPVLLIAFMLMVPFIIVAEKKQQMKSVVLIALAVMMLALGLMSQVQTLWGWAIALGVFFWAFNILEASLPSWLSKIAPAGAKGSAMGVYSTLQFFGAFVGGSVGGLALRCWGHEGLFIALGAVVALWSLVVALAAKPRHLNSVRLALPEKTDAAQVHLNHEPAPEKPNMREAFAECVLAQPGVVEAVCIPEEGALYLKVDASQFDYQQTLAQIELLGEYHGS